jgi:hypothetical protein
MIPADTFAAFGRAVYERRLHQGLAVARAPESEMIRTTAPDRRFAVAVADPSACCADLMADHGLPPAAATRYVADSLATLQFAANPAERPILLGAETSLADVVRYLSMRFPDVQASRETIARLADDPELQMLETRAKAPRGPAPPHLAGATEALWAALTRNRGCEPLAAFWSPELFVYPGHDGTPETLDLTGAARFLVYGPYIRLPKGDWSCGLAVAAHALPDPVHLLVEAVCGADVKRVRFELPEPGELELEFSFAVPAADAPVEVRLYLEEAAFDGEIAFKGATLSALAAPKAYPSGPQPQ